jgi:hypothetical protein
MHVKLMQMYRLIQHMHKRKGDRFVVLINGYPDVLVRQVDFGRDSVIVSQIGIGRGTEYRCGGPLNERERREVIRARASDGNDMSHWRCSAGRLSA